MKVLILSITAGQGHNATGKAVSDYLKSQGVQCATLDTYEYAAPLIKEAVDKGYLLNVSYTPELFGKMYRMAEKKPYHRYQMPFSFLRMVNRRFAAEIIELVDEYQPDAIVCTHVFAAAVVNVLKASYHLQAITVGVITDFTVHPFWEDTPHLDYYVTASEYLAYQLLKKGLDASKMLPFGIPIHPKFSEKLPQAEARRQLGLAEDGKTILIMGGSMGHGHFDELITRLDKLPIDFQLLVICGSNDAMRQKLTALETAKPIQVYGFVDNVDVFMDASDCLIGKPGGLTTSEALAKELPMIMVDPIPGQEERNVEFLLNNGLALSVSDTLPVEEAVYYLLYNDGRREVLVDTVRRLGKKHSAKRLGDFLIQQMAEQ